jgi:hypothetical protein
MHPNQPPDGLPIYRVLTGPDDAAFCIRVSEALALGYRLYGPPAATFDGRSVIVAQAVIWPTVDAAVAMSVKRDPA